MYSEGKLVLHLQILKFLLALQFYQYCSRNCSEVKDWLVDASFVNMNLLGNFESLRLGKNQILGYENLVKIKFLQFWKSQT